MHSSIKVSKKINQKTPLLQYERRARDVRKAEAAVLNSTEVSNESAYFSCGRLRTEIPTKKSSALFHDIFQSITVAERFDVEKIVVDFLTSREVSNLHKLNKNTWKNVFKNKEILKEYITSILDFYKIEENLKIVENFFSPFQNYHSQCLSKDYFNFKFDVDKILNIDKVHLRKNKVAEIIKEFQLSKDDEYEVDFFTQSSDITFASKKLDIKREKVMQNTVYVCIALFYLFLFPISPTDNIKTKRLIAGYSINFALTCLGLILFIKGYSESAKKVLKKIMPDKRNNKTLSLLFSNLPIEVKENIKSFYHFNILRMSESQKKKLDNALKLLLTTDYFKSAADGLSAAIDMPD